MSRFSSLLLSCIILLASSLALGQTRSRWSTGIDFTERASKREGSRWSLSDWLAMKDRNRMMDQWLSLNTPSPFEFMLGASYLSNNIEDTGGTNQGAKSSGVSYLAEAAAYAKFVGLSSDYELNEGEDYSSLSGLFNLRLLGNSIQNTSLTLSYGLRTKEISATPDTRLSQQFGQAALQLYLMKYFGIDGKYRYYLKTNNDDLGDVTGDLVEAGVFIDFKALRVFGTWYKENIKTQIPASAEESSERSGIRTGLKFFF